MEYYRQLNQIINQLKEKYLLSWSPANEFCIIHATIINTPKNIEPVMIIPQDLDLFNQISSGLLKNFPNMEVFLSHHNMQDLFDRNVNVYQRSKSLYPYWKEENATICYFMTSFENGSEIEEVEDHIPYCTPELENLIVSVLSKDNPSRKFKTSLVTRE